MIAAGVTEEFRKQGVRFNDLGIYKRSHRFYDNSAASPDPVAIGA